MSNSTSEAEFDRNSNTIKTKRSKASPCPPSYTTFQRRSQVIVLVVLIIVLLISVSGPAFYLALIFVSPSIALLYAIWIYIDRETRNTGGRGLSFIRRIFIWKLFRNYFPLKLVKTADLDPSRNYLLGAHPHGVFCSGPFASFATDALGFPEIFPKMTPHLLTLDSFFWVPFTREWFLSFGTVPATKKSMEYLLNYPGGGKMAVLVPGGLLEMIESRPNRNMIKLKDRKGFIKVALQHGSPIVPVYSFGDTSTYDQYGNEEGSLIRKIQIALIKYFDFYIPIANGRGITQYAFGPLPRRTPITTVVGAPIEVVKSVKPTQEQIDSLHQKYVTALKDLFYTNREKYGYPDAELEEL
jgi:1-acyl-sn-glycerol-3-phosphate acyltransferase